MAKQFKMARDKFGFPTYGIPWPESDANFEVLLAAGVAAEITIPEGYNFVVFAYANGTDVWANIDAPAVVPSSGTFVASTQQLNPQARWLTGDETTISMISSTLAYVSACFYTVPELG